MGITIGQAVMVGIAMVGSALVMALVVLASVALGAWVVFRTKRDSGESLFNFSKPEEGGAFTAPGEYDDDTGLPLGQDVSQRLVDDALARVMSQNARFHSQNGPDAPILRKEPRHEQ
jgi:hypothetical protein